MKSYALIIGIPLAVFIQYIYSEVCENFRKARNIFCSIFEIVITIACILGKISHIFCNYLCVEVWVIATGSLIIARIMQRNTEEVPIEEFNQGEIPFVIIPALAGIVVCMIPFMSFYTEYISVYEKYEIKLSIVFFELLGMSMIFCNRAIYYAVHRLGKR